MSLTILTVSHFQQRERGDCLVACVAMVLDYMGIQQSYRRLYKLLNIKKGLGTALYNIRRLEKLGVTILFQQGNLAQLHSHLKQNEPSIVPVKTAELPYWKEDTDHAVVVVGLDDQFVYLNDPFFPVAPLRVSTGDFDLAWLERDEFYAVLQP